MKAILILLCLISFNTYAAQGNVKELYPPQNDGKISGVGIISGDDGKEYMFRTPGDNNGEVLKTGEEVTFDIVGEKQASSVTIFKSEFPSYLSDRVKIVKNGCETIVYLLDAEGNPTHKFLMEDGMSLKLSPKGGEPNKIKTETEVEKDI